MSQDFLPHVFWKRCIRVLWEQRQFYLNAFLIFYSLLILHHYGFNHFSQKNSLKLMDMLLNQASFENFLNFRKIDFLLDSANILSAFFLNVVFMFLVLSKVHEFFNARFEKGISEHIRIALRWTVIRSGMLGILLIVSFLSVSYSILTPLFMIMLPLVLTPAWMIYSSSKLFRTIGFIVSFNFLQNIGNYFFAIYLSISTLIVWLFLTEILQEYVWDFRVDLLFWFYLKGHNLDRFVHELLIHFRLVLSLISVLIFSVASMSLVEVIEQNRKLQSPPGSELN